MLALQMLTWDAISGHMGSKIEKVLTPWTSRLPRPHKLMSRGNIYRILWQIVARTNTQDTSLTNNR